MRTLLASLLLSTVLFGSSVAGATPPCGKPGTPLVLFDTEPDVVRVRVVPGSQQVMEGGNSYEFVVLETLRGKTKVGATLSGGSGGPCARTLVEGDEYVFALGHANDIGVGRVNAGTRDMLPTSIGLQSAIAKTKATDTRGRAALIYKAANAKTATKGDLLSMLSYLAAKPDVVAGLSAAQRRRLDTLFADAKLSQPELGTVWERLIKK